MNKNPCLSCDCWDSEREGCTMHSTDMWYACPIESQKPENQEALRKLAEDYLNNRMTFIERHSIYGIHLVEHDERKE